MTHPAHNLPPAPGWAIHPSMMTTCSELPGYRIVKTVAVLADVGHDAGIALGRLANTAREKGANALIGVQMSAAPIGAAGGIGHAYLIAATAVWADYA